MGCEEQRPDPYPSNGGRVRGSLRRGRLSLKCPAQTSEPSAVGDGSRLIVNLSQATERPAAGEGLELGVQGFQDVEVKPSLGRLAQPLQLCYPGFPDSELCLVPHSTPPITGRAGPLPVAGACHSEITLRCPVHSLPIHDPHKLSSCLTHTPGHPAAGGPPAE